MSVYRNYYVIAGYDLTKYKTDKFNNWRWSLESDDYLRYKRKNKIQLFDDPMNGSYLFLGYILANANEHDYFEVTKIPLSKPRVNMDDVVDVLGHLEKIGVIKTPDGVGFDEILEYQIIVFEEDA